MRTYGSIELIEKDLTQFWKVTAEPHVMIKLKALITRFDKSSIGVVKIRNSPEVCRDLEWFCQRYPLVVKDLADMQCGADEYRETMENLEQIQRPDYKARKFSMALPPRQYQVVAAEICLKKGSLLLADSLGLGKSVSALATLSEKATLPALIVCESHLPKQWADYCEKFLPKAKVHTINKVKRYDLPSADIYIITYHKLASWAEILRGMIRSVIFDEVQALRHNESMKYGAAFGIREKASFCMGLSATPIYNYGGEIFNIMEMISPGNLGTRDEFEREWCRGYGKNILLKDPDAFGAYMREQFLMLRRTRKDVGRELPALQTIVEEIEFNQYILDDLEATATELAHRILKVDSSFHDKGEAAREFDLKLRQATGIAKAPFVAAFVKMLVEDGEKVVLTGWHRAVYDVWDDHLRDLGIVYYTGEETGGPKGQKAKSVEAFVKGDAKILAMSLRSGAGLDGLQEVCSTIVHGEMDWSPGVHQQCTGRLHRDGQKNSVMEYYLTSSGGSDPIIAEIIGLKRAQVGGILEVGGSSGLTKLQSTETARVKRMAEMYLKKRRKSDGE